MDSFKEMWTLFWKNVWQTFKSSLIVLLMFVGVSSMVFMMSFKGTLSDGLTGTRAAWVFGGIAVGLAYQALMMFATGGQGYEMLVSGNMKRRSAAAMGTSMKISSHKVEKEFRYWKGFVTPWFIVLLTVVIGIVFGVNQAEIDRILASTNEKEAMTLGLGIAVLVLLMIAGWSVLPFMFINLGGVYVSYYWSILLGILPVIVSGG